MNDVRKERFRRVAAARTAKVIAMLRLLGNCSDPRSYSFTSKDTQALLQLIEAAVADVKRRFANPSPHKGPQFVLNERNDTK